MKANEKKKYLEGKFIKTNSNNYSINNNFK
jgi:hypothetical protein